MKQGVILLLAALLVAPPALAEEAFFSEESFEMSGIDGDEGFFEESAFFAEGDFFDGIAEIAAPLEETPDEEEAEDRSLLLLATDSETNHYLPPEYTVKQGYYAGNPYKLKPGEVKLAWEQKLLGGKPVKKLAKGWKWVIYRAEEEDGIWLQVATSKKPKITLKNQPVGEHMYIVRPEYKKGNEEIYGEHSGSGMNPWDFRSYCTIGVWGSNLWKTINSLTVTPRLSSTDPRIDYSFTTSDVSASLIDGSEVRYRIRLYGYKGKKKTMLYPKDPSVDPWLLHLTETYNNNNYRVFNYYNNNFKIKSYLDSGITKFEFQLTPVVWKDNKVTQTGKTKKATVIVAPENGRWKNTPPIITRVERKRFNLVSMVWEHGTWSSWEETPAYYEIYDGKKLLTTINGGKPTDDLHYADIYINAPGKHKLTVRACSGDKKARGKASAAYTLTIPKAENDAPIIDKVNVILGSGDTDAVEVYWSNPNPMLTNFQVIVMPRQRSAFYDDSYWSEIKDEWLGSAHFSSNSVGNALYMVVDNVQNGTEYSSRQDYLICVIGFTPDMKQQFRSNPVYARKTDSGDKYTYEFVKLKR